MRSHLPLLFLILIAYCSYPMRANAQDPRFSQFYKAPVQLNPALSGVFNGRLRVHGNYRALYASLLQDNAFQTYAIGVDMRFRPNRQDAASANFTMMTDRSGANGFSRTFGAAGGSYLKLLSKGAYNAADHYLVAGVQAGFGQYRIDNQDLWFSNQYDGQNLEIDFDRDSGEPIGAFSGEPFLEVHAGLLYYLVGEDRSSLFIGGALHHLNQPQISFFDDAPAETLSMRWTVHSGGEFATSRRLSFLPGAAFMQQGPANSLTAGFNARYSNWGRWELALRAGPWVHFSNQLDQGMQLDAIIIAVVFELQRWNFGISYDMTTSPLGRANYARGALEFSATWFMDKDWGKYKVRCPEY